MAKIVLDANIPISFSNSKVDLLKTFIKFCERSGHKILMPKEVFDECWDRTLKKSLGNSVCFKKFSTNKSKFNIIKRDCKLANPAYIKDNDYRVIVLACLEKADMLVTNDHPLANVVEAYKKAKGIPKEQIVISSPAGLLWFMYCKRKDMFPWKQHIETNLKFFHHIELPHIYKGITKREWSVIWAKERFNTFADNILKTIEPMS